MAIFAWASGNLARLFAKGCCFGLGGLPTLLGGLAKSSVYVYYVCLK